MTEVAPAKLEKKDFFWNADDQVLIRSSEVVNNLILDKERSVQQLSQFSPITLDKIAIDETGNVIITDAAFNKKLSDLASVGGGGPTNFGELCGVLNIGTCSGGAEV